VSNRIVQFDVDGVLADFGTGYDRLCRMLGLIPPGPEAPWDAKWDTDVWANIRSSVDFWMNLPALVPDAIFARIQRIAEPVYFVTARPGTRTKWQTEEWLKDRGVYEPTVIVTGKKAEFAHAVGVTHAIDDKAGNAVAIQYMAPRTKSYLLDEPYNRFDHSVLGSKVIRVKQVGEFMAAVETA
jgi:hypothetical protein